MKKLLAILLALIMMLTTVSAMAAAAPEKWDISKSKTATNLDANYESKVTLSLPSKEEKLVSDVVFVIDKSNSSKQVSITEGIEMLKKLLLSATLKVGVIVFDGKAYEAYPLQDFNADKVEAIVQAIQTVPTADQKVGGTNIQAGLAMAKTMLEADSAVDTGRKHVILVSDGLTRLFGTDSIKIIYNEMNADGNVYFGEYTAWSVGKYGFGDGIYKIPEGSWQSYYEKLQNWVTTDGDKYVMDYTKGKDTISPKPEKYIPIDEFSEHACCVDRAFYEAYQAYLALSDYHFYAVCTNNVANNQLGIAFMEALNKGATINFDKIGDDILYLVGAGSTVTDRMGKTADYDFDYINSAASLSLKVGETAYAVSAKTESLNEHETARYLFTSDGVVAANQAEAPFVLHYYAKGTDGASDECFVWDINVPVSNFAPVQLTYKVKLTNPKTAPGTYGTYDADGSKNDGSENYEGLYTNNSAVLIPKNSSGGIGADETFNKPTVSYTVSGGGGGHTHYDPTPSVPVVVVVPPKTGDMPLWYGIARFLGLVK